MKIRPLNLCLFLPDRFARWCVVLVMFASLVTICGCRSASTGAADAAATAPEASAEKPAAKGPIASLVPRAATLDESPLLVNQIAPEKAAGEKDAFVLPERQVDEGGVIKPEYPAGLIKGIKDPEAKVKVAFNLDATPLTEVVPLFADLLKFNFYIDPSIKGAVTITLDSEMSAREVWDLFEHILWLSGAYASRNPGFIHIMPFAKMPQERRLLAKHEPMANVDVSFIRVLNAKSSEIMGYLKPFMTEGASATDIQRLNTLLIVETPANMPKLRELIARLDDKGEAGWPEVCFACHQVDAEVIRDELLAILPVIGLPVTDKSSAGGEIKITVVPRLQVIIASAPLKDALDEVGRWIRVLDKENTAEQENLFFYNVKHSTADTLNEALGVFFNTSGSTNASKPTTNKSTSGKTTKTGSKEVPVSTPTPPASTPSKTTTTPKAQKQAGEVTTIFDTPVTVYSDSDQNRLTIMTTPRAYAMVNALLSRLDVPPRQVLIQATITEITLNKKTEFGISYAINQTFGTDGVLKGAGINPVKTDGKDLSANPDPKALAGGLSILLTKGADRIAFLRALAGETNVRVLSAPQILASNDKEATINVGDRVPIITGDYTNLNGSNNTNQSTYQSVQYQDTGTILTVTPHISAGNDVRLEVKQEVSEAVENNLTTIQSPTIQNRTLETQCVVPDGGTILMGGLIKTKTEDSHSGVPYLMDIPVLGRLFRTNIKNNERTELLVMLTVNVIEPSTDIDKLARRYREALKEVRDKMGK